MLPQNSSDAEVAAAYQTAIRALQAGNPAQANEICRTILQIRPAHFGTLCLHTVLAAL